MKLEAFVEKVQVDQRAGLSEYRVQVRLSMVGFCSAAEAEEILTVWQKKGLCTVDTWVDSNGRGRSVTINFKE